MSLKSELSGISDRDGLILSAVDGFFAKELSNGYPADEAREALKSRYPVFNEVIGQIIYKLDIESPYNKIVIEFMGIGACFLAAVLVEIAELKDMPTFE